jgi:hypothetical protein
VSLGLGTMPLDQRTKLRRLRGSSQHGQRLEHQMLRTVKIADVVDHQGLQ